MPDNISGTEAAFAHSMYKQSALSESVSCVAIKDTNSRMFVCCPWNGLLLWANKIEDKHLPYISVENGHHYVTLNYCIGGRCEVCLPDNTYIYMEQGMLCIDEHEPKGGYWYPNRDYTGLELVFDLDLLAGQPIAAMSDYCNYDGWIRELLSAHNGTYLGGVVNECDRLMNLLYSHLTAADWKLADYRMHLMLLLYTLINGGTAPIKDRFYITKGQKRIADEVEQMITQNLSRHYTITDIAKKYGVSSSALKKYFEAVYGQPISFYLREKRILLAKQQLSKTKDSVGMIAAACGYANQGKFGAVFKECTGLSPLEYRRINYQE